MSFRLPFHGILILLAAVLSSGTAWASQGDDQLRGFGILGDSGSDEFRADDDRGGEHASTTLNWAELLVRYRGLNLGPWGKWNEPRRSGYAYNWARSGATTADIVRSGQVAGLSQQVAAGKVSTVVLMVGANDFAIWNGSYEAVYEGRIRGSALKSKLQAILENIHDAVDEIQAAGPTKIFVATLIDRGVAARFQKAFPDAIKRRRITDAVIVLNAGIRRLSIERGLFLVDQFAVGQALLSRVVENGRVAIGGNRSASSSRVMSRTTSCLGMTSISGPWDQVCWPISSLRLSEPLVFALPPLMSMNSFAWPAFNSNKPRRAIDPMQVEPAGRSEASLERRAATPKARTVDAAIPYPGSEEKIRQEDPSLRRGAGGASTPANIHSVAGFGVSRPARRPMGTLR